MTNRIPISDSAIINSGDNFDVDVSFDSTLDESVFFSSDLITEALTGIGGGFIVTNIRLREGVFDINTISGTINTPYKSTALGAKLWVQGGLLNIPGVNNINVIGVYKTSGPPTIGGFLGGLIPSVPTSTTITFIALAIIALIILFLLLRK